MRIVLLVFILALLSLCYSQEWKQMYQEEEDFLVKSVLNIKSSQSAVKAAPKTASLAGRMKDSLVSGAICVRDICFSSIKQVAAIAYNNLVYCDAEDAGIDNSEIDEVEHQQMPIAYALSSAIYHYDPKVGLPKSLNTLKFIFRNTEGTSGVVDVLESHDTIYIVGRGTQTLGDAVIDLKSAAFKLSALGGKISRAFHDTAQTKSDEIDQLIDEAVEKGKRVIATGHSLGAVTSRIKLLMYAESRPEFRDYDDVYHIGFGTPAFGDAKSQQYIAETYNNFHIIDVKNHRNGRVDVVTSSTVPSGFGVKSANHAKVVRHYQECPITYANYLKGWMPTSSANDRTLAHFMVNYNLDKQGSLDVAPRKKKPSLEDLD